MRGVPWGLSNRWERIVTNVSAWWWASTRGLQWQCAGMLCQGGTSSSRTCRAWQDGEPSRWGAFGGFHFSPHPVQRGPVAQRHHRVSMFNQRSREFDSAWPIMAQIVLYGRDQPRHPPRPSRPCGPWKAPVIGGRADLSPAGAVHGDGHPEPNRIRGHLPVPRPARSLF
jgi:hypothetical protein